MPGTRPGMTNIEGHRLCCRPLSWEAAAIQGEFATPFGQPGTA
jgi:hypothetical protein